MKVDGMRIAEQIPFLRRFSVLKGLRSKAVYSVGRTYRVLHQHGNRHRPNAAWNRRDRTGDVTGRLLPWRFRLDSRR